MQTDLFGAGRKYVSTKYAAVIKLLLGSFPQIIWQACSNILPTTVNLYARKVDYPQECNLCRKAIETIHHIFIHYEVVMACWNKFNKTVLDGATQLGNGLEGTWKL